MLSASSRSAFTRANHLTRSFATTARVAQAVQKPVLEKEFKIYRWVCAFLLLDASYSRENSKRRVIRILMNLPRNPLCSLTKLT